MTQIFIKTTPDSGRTDLCHFFGKLNIILSLDKSTEISSDYSFSLYNDHLCMLLYADSHSKEVRRKDRDINVAFKDSIIWMPGHYFLLFYSGNTVLRFDLQLDNKGSLSECGISECPKLSPDDILARRISGKPHWKIFSSTPGLIQWKRWLIGRIQQIELNSLRAEKLHGVLEFSNNMLITSETSDFIWRSLLLFGRLAEIKCETKRTNSDSLMGNKDNYPYDKIDEIFHEEEDSDNILGIPLPSMKERLFIFFNIGTLLKPGMENVLDKIIDKCPSYYDSALFCGTEADIRELLERKPELQIKFPKFNRFSSEPAALEELILTFFREADNAKLKFSPKAVDAACRLLSEKYNQGLITSWTITDVRQYVKGTIIPAYTQRAITAIQQGASTTEVLDIQAEDLDLLL